MRFGTVPPLVEQARPWAVTKVIGPPRGREALIGDLVAQVDDSTELGRAYRVFLEFDEGELEQVMAGGVIEVAFYCGPVMYPISTQVWPPS